MSRTLASAAADLRAGRVTAVALVEEALAAVGAHGARTNAFTTVDAEGARAAAVAVDRERAHGVDRGPLHGLPISLKDLIDERGVVTTAASRVISDRVADRDAPVVARLREAGAIVIGRTNLHEFALGTTSDESAFGAVRHPRDPGRSPGGSSGGSAAAVVTGMGLASIGTDTGGSVRIPAAACGIVGLKPAFDDVPTEGVIPLSTSYDHVGPLTLTVEDAALLWDVLSGRRTAEETGVPASLTLARLIGYFDAPLDRDVRAAFDGALARLHEAGVRVETREVAGADRTPLAYMHVALPEAAAWHAPYMDARADRYTAGVRARLESGRGITGVQYVQAQTTRAALRGAVDAALDGVDALVLPTLPIVAPPIGATDVPLDPDRGDTMPVRAAMLKHTQLFDLTGHPAISLPLAVDGWPVGLQIVGPARRTARLLAIAAACEKIVSRHA